MIKSTGTFILGMFVKHFYLMPSLLLFNSHSTPASQSPHSSNPSSLPSSLNTQPQFCPLSPILDPLGLQDNRDRRTADRWKTDKPGESQSSLLSRSELTDFVSFLDLWQWKNIFLNYSFLFIPSHGWVWHRLSLSSIILSQLASGQHSK